MKTIKVLTDIPLIEKLSRKIEIVHHAPGRVRFKFEKSIINDIDSDSLLELENMGAVDGVRDVRLNKLAKSLAIAYDPKVIEPHIWEDLAGGVSPEEISKRFLSLINKGE